MRNAQPQGRVDVVLDVVTVGEDVLGFVIGRFRGVCRYVPEEVDGRAGECGFAVGETEGRIPGRVHGYCGLDLWVDGEDGGCVVAGEGWVVVLEE